MRGTVEVTVGIGQAGAVAAAMDLANVKKQTEVRLPYVYGDRGYIYGYRGPGQGVFGGGRREYVV
jgi:hypothetical protein